jgi:hypothetical protein
MAPKRAAIPADTFTKPPSALDKLTGRTRTEETVEPQYSDTVVPQNSNTVKQHIDGEDVAREKITFYLRPDQTDKLDDLVRAYKRQTGKRINRNEVVRRLIDFCDLDVLLRASQQ